jgi:hypothetical protein
MTLETAFNRQRKYKAFWGVFIVVSAALFFDKLTGTEYANLVWPIFGLYMGGNVGEHFSKKEQS